MKLTFIGDIMCSNDIIQAYNRGSHPLDFSDIFKEVAPLFSQSDYVIGNLETPLTRSRNFTTKQYQFNAPIEFAAALKLANINFVSTANNHCLDAGVSGLQETIDILDQLHLQHTGTFKQSSSSTQPCLLDSPIGQIGILSYTYGTNAFENHQYLHHRDFFKVNLLQNQELSNPFTRFFYHRSDFISKVYNKLRRLLFDHHSPVYERPEFHHKCRRHLKRDLRHLRQSGASHIIMLLHEGGQYNASPIPRAKRTIKFLQKHHVDIIIGNHEHVVQKADLTPDTFVAYSLGNFNSFNGVYTEPFDKLGEYSIALHLYLETNQPPRYTFSVLKTVQSPHHHIRVIPAFELLQTVHSDAKAQLTHDTLKIAKTFSGRSYSSIQSEFPLS